MPEVARKSVELGLALLALYQQLCVSQQPLYGKLCFTPLIYPFGSSTRSFVMCAYCRGEAPARTPTAGPADARTETVVA